MRVVAILQCRMNSSRLPGKMLLPLLEKPLVRHVIERVRRATKLDCVVLAYPLLDHPSFMPVLKSFMDTSGVSLGSWAGQGNENDLIERYLGAARAYHADIIVRIPCDNPCVDPEYIDKAIEIYLAWPEVFVSNAGWAEVGADIVDGIGCEVFSVSRLKWLDEATKGSPKYREHPHMMFHDHKAKDAKWSEQRQVLRLDVNTKTDYEFIKDIYDHFNRNDFTAAEIVAYLDSKKVTA